MLRSMYSGIGGMRGFQNKLDVIGNNIANVNTAGFKKSRVTFQDILSQTQAGGNAATARMGGTNPKQVGLGSSLATIDVIHTQGGLMNTNVPSDLAIQGNGFFIVAPDPSKLYTNGDFTQAPLNKLGGDEYFLTRAGNFSIDSEGNLVTANGMFVLGKVTDGSSPANETLQKINLLTDAKGNRLAYKTKDSQGNDIYVPVKVKSYSIGTDGSVTVSYDNKPDAMLPIKPDGTFDAGTDLGADYETAYADRAAKRTVGLATVTNPAGLEKQGNNLYKVTAASNSGDNPTTLALETTNGNVLLGAPATGDRGPVYAGQLEMSNVDLAEEFTEMIVAQRGFQANSRIITTSDSILEELVNLKR